MSSSEESGCAYRVLIDPEKLESALKEYVRVPNGDPSEFKPGFDRPMRAEIFRRFATNVLQRSVFTYTDFYWPEAMWRSLPELSTQRQMGLGELVLSLTSKEVFFWGHEIGKLMHVEDPVPCWRCGAPPDPLAGEPVGGC